MCTVSGTSGLCRTERVGPSAFHPRAYSAEKGVPVGWAQRRALGHGGRHRLPSALAFLQVELKSQEAQGLQEQRDQCLSHLQQYAAAYQQHQVAYEQLTSEKEALHKQLLLQTQLMDQLQHEEVQGKMAAEMARQELQEAQVRQLLCKTRPKGRTWPPLPSHSFLAP